MDIGRNYNGPETAMVGTSRQLTLTEQLESNKRHLEERLAEINAALEALKKNPELQNLFDVIAKVRY